MKNTRQALAQISLILPLSLAGYWSGSRVSQTIAAESETATTPSMTEMTECMTYADSYAHGGWKLFQSNICEANYLWPSFAENVKNMLDEVGVTDSDLADGATVTGTIGGKDATVVLSTPTDTTTFPYEHKAVISIEGKTKAVAYWSGVDESSKGFVIYGPTSAGTFPEIVTSSSLTYGAYLNWDKTGDRQQMQVLAGKWLATKSYGEPDLTLPSPGDAKTVSQYIKYTKQISTDTVEDLQFVRIRNGLDSELGNNSCYRQRMWGRLTAKGSTSTGSVVTFNTPGSNADSVTSTDVDGTSSSGTDTSDLSSSEEFEDSVGYANGSHRSQGAHTFSSSYTPMLGTAISAPGNFDFSCADVKTTKANLFAVSGDVVDFDATPSEVFPNPTAQFTP